MTSYTDSLSEGRKQKNAFATLIKTRQPAAAAAAAAAKSPQSCPTLCDPIDGNPPGSPAWDSPGKNTGVGCHFLLQGIFLTQGSNPHFLHHLHWQAVLYN